MCRRVPVLFNGKNTQHLQVFGIHPGIYERVFLLPRNVGKVHQQRMRLCHAGFGGRQPDVFRGYRILDGADNADAGFAGTAERAQLIVCAVPVDVRIHCLNERFIRLQGKSGKNPFAFLKSASAGICVRLFPGCGAGNGNSRRYGILFRILRFLPEKKHKYNCSGQDSHCQNQEDKGSCSHIFPI